MIPKMYGYEFFAEVFPYVFFFIRHLLSPLQRTHTLLTHFRHDFSNIIRYIMSLHISYLIMFHIRTNYLITILLGSRIKPYRKECSNVRTIILCLHFVRMPHRPPHIQQLTSVGTIYARDPYTIFIFSRSRVVYLPPNIGQDRIRWVLHD